MTNKYVVFAFLLVAFYTTWGQSAAISPAIQNEWNDPIIQQLYGPAAPWGQFSQQSEDVSKRTRTSKHFPNGSNTYSAFLGGGPVHYQENNDWLTIATNVVANTSGNHSNYPYYNKWNAFKSYYGTSGNGVLIDLPTAQSVEIAKNAQWLWMDANGNSLGNVSANTGINPTANGFSLTYSNLFTGVDGYIEQLAQGVETSYLIQNLNSFQNTPAQTEYVAFAETIEIPATWTVTGLDQKASGVFGRIAVKEGANTMLMYEVPKMWENLQMQKNNDAVTERKLQGVYRFTQNGNQITIYTLVPLTWLTSTDRTFPITIDPIVTVYPYSTNLSTVEIEDGVSNPRIGFFDGTFGNTYYKSGIDFDVSSIPDVNASGVTAICDLNLWMYQIGYNGITNCGSCSSEDGKFTFVSMLGAVPPTVWPQGYGTFVAELNAGQNYTPSYGWGSSAGAPNISYSYNTNNQWKSFPLNLTARQDLTALLGGDHFPVGIRNDLGGHGDPTFCGLFTICNDDDYVTWQGNSQPATQPYLTVSYEASLAVPASACGNGNDANPNNDWIVLGYQGTDLTLTNSTIYYDGFASFGGLDVVSTTKWGSTLSPSATSGYQGCTIPNDNHIAVFKRCGFPCGQYDLNLTNVNGSGQFYMNGAFVAAFSGNQNLLTNAILDANTSIEIRYLSTTGASQITIDFTRLDNWKATAGADIQSCPGAAINLVSAVNGSGTPGLMPCIAGAVGSCGPTAYSWASNCGGFPSNPTTPNVSFNYQGGPCQVYLIITSEIGCVSRDTVDFSELPIPTVTATAQFNQLCSGSTANILLSNFLAGSSFCVTVLNANTTVPQCPTGIVPSGGQLAIPLTLPAGVTTAQQAQIIVTPSIVGPSCASFADTVTITVLPQPQIVVSGQSVICSGDPLNICLFNTLSNNSAFTWARSNNVLTGLGMSGSVLPPNTCVTGTLNNNSAAAQTTTFTFNTVGGSCPASPTTFAVTVNPDPIASITSSSPCTGGTLTALPAGMTYSWSNGLTTQSIIANTAGTYTVWVTNANGCQSQASVVVNTSPGVAIYTNPANTTSTCGGQITMTAVPQNPNYVYTWNPATCTGPSCTISQAGTYTYQVTATDVGTGCASTSAPLTLTIYDKPSVALGASTGSASPLCADPNANLNVVFNPNGTSAAPYNYNWYSITNGSGSWLPIPGASSNAIPAIISNGSATTEYYVSVITDANGCSDTTNIFAVNPKPVLTLTALDTSAIACQGETLSFNYSSNLGGIFNCGSLNGAAPNCNNGTLTATQSGTYWVMCQAPNGCVDTAFTPALVFNPTPVAVISLAVGQDSLLCRNESIVLSAAPAGLSSYQWWMNGVQIPGATNATYTATTGGNYAVEVGNSFGCMGMDAQLITSVDTLLANIVSSQPDLAFCQGQDEAILTAPQGGNNYLWTMGTVNYVGNPFTVNSINYQAPGTVNLAITNAAGCVSHATINIAMVQAPQPFITEAIGSGQLNLCIGDTLTLHGNGGPSYLWKKDGQALSGGTAANYTIYASPDLSQWVGNYNLFVENAGGCTGESKTFVIQANPEPYGIMYIVGNTHICKGQSATLVAAELTGIPEWTFNGTVIPNSLGQSEITVTEPGQYNVTITNICGSFTVMTPITITRNDDILANFNYYPTLIHPTEIVSFSNQSTGGLYATWVFGDGFQSSSYNAQHGFPLPGEYQVTMTISDELGCQDDTARTLTVVAWGEPFIPNTFTPNGDGSHDNFDIYYADLQGIDTKVFDRWGSLVFETFSKDRSWDGNNTNGNLCEPGTYYYTITASKSTNGEKVVYKGFITLLR